jgi:hypothetical protein
MRCYNCLLGGHLRIMLWLSIAPCLSSCAGGLLLTAVTAHDGSFGTPAWAFPSAVSYAEHDMRYRVFKPGLIFHQQSLIGATLEMVKFPGSREDRLKELLRLSANSYCTIYPSAGIAEMKKAIGDEVEKLVKTAEERKAYLDPIRESTRTELQVVEAYRQHLLREGKGK